jgi:lysophospholipase L1-like esterase
MRTKYKIILRLILILFFAFGEIIGCKAPINSPIRVACIGDSITEGGYPQECLASLLGSDYLVSNFGKGSMCMLKGPDCGEQWSYWNTQAFTDSKQWEPDIVIIMLGTGDSCYGADAIGDWRLPDLGAKYLAAYKEMIEIYKKLPSHPKIFCVTPPYIYQTDPKFYVSNNVLETELIPNLILAANETGCKVIDVHTATAGMPQNFPDLVHPNAQGKQVIANIIYKSIISR